MERDAKERKRERETEIEQEEKVKKQKEWEKDWEVGVLGGYMVSFRNVSIDTSSFRSAHFPEIVHFNFRIEDVTE